MKHVLPIKGSYVSRWGLWESLRELVQNAKDEEEEHGHPMQITHEDGWLYIDNAGADLDVTALLLGETSKTDKKLRGEHGEGLDLAFLAGVRAGHYIEVLTKTEKWVPALECVAQYNDTQCLVVNTEPLPEKRDGVRIAIRVDLKDWDELKTRFLFLCPATTDVVETPIGNLLCDKTHRGKVYVKGIYAMSSDNSYGFGFDLADVRLDRDRRLIDPFDLQWTMASIINKSLSQDTRHLAKPVLELLSKASSQVVYLGMHATKDSEASKILAEVFKQEHGDNAIPVRSLAESQQLERLGYKGVLVTEAAESILRTEIGSYASIVADHQRKPLRRYASHELNKDEADRLGALQDALAPIVAEHFKEPPKLQAVEFAEESLRGIVSPDTGEVCLRRSRCQNYFDLLDDAIHAIASELGQGLPGSLRLTEQMWRTLYENVSKGAV